MHHSRNHARFTRCAPQSCNPAHMRSKLPRNGHKFSWTQCEFKDTAFFRFRGPTCESLSPARTAEHFPPSTACQGHQTLKGTPNPDKNRCILMPCTCFCLYLTARFARVGACEVSEGRIQRGEDEGMRDSVQFVPQRADKSRNNSNKELKSTQRER